MWFYKASKQTLPLSSRVLEVVSDISFESKLLAISSSSVVSIVVRSFASPKASVLFIFGVPVASMVVSSYTSVE